ncbi:MAG TPA: fibronectin type III domain-containing protein, partial [Acidimicrobiales bacterium]|nr:fibronectin type III domain-containing protein [Acidimicrobiales bacterium]
DDQLHGDGMKAWRVAFAWVGVLILAAVMVLVGAGRAHAQAPGAPQAVRSDCGFFCPPSTTTTTLPPTTTTTVATSTTTTPPAPYTVSFSPCSGTTNPGPPCTQSPDQIQVQYPARAPAAVVRSWDASGRSAAAPSPDSLSVTLPASDGTACGTDLICWPWPSGMTDGSFILNGTYQVAVCPAPDANYDSTSGTCRATDPAQNIGLAVPPSPPTGVTAKSAGNQVTLSWKAPAQAPPDLVGYSVSRGSTVVYTCSTDDLGPGSATPCPASLTVADRPGNGEYTYSVSSIRLGVDTNNANVVTSHAVEDSAGVITVPGPVTGGGAGAGSQGGLGGPVQTSGGNTSAIGTVLGTDGGTLVTLPTVQGTGSAAASSPVPNLKYPADSPVVGKSSDVALKVNDSASRPDIVPVTVLALGILILAIAAHFLYLRVELGVIQARLRTTGRQRAPEG